jgi:hypothetical protein
MHTLLLLLFLDLMKLLSHTLDTFCRVRTTTITTAYTLLYSLPKNAPRVVPTCITYYSVFVCQYMHRLLLSLLPLLLVLPLLP